MGFRTIVITKRAKLNYSMGMMEVRGEENIKVFLDDMDTLMIESQMVSMTSSLLTELIKKKIKVIFCDEKRNPQSELVPYYGSRDSSRKLKKQIAWTNTAKEKIWTTIVREKIRNQALFLKELNKPREYELLDGYLQDLQEGDITNREGLAAKVYFNALFGMDFNREEESVTNAALNYGYSLLLSTFNKEISYNGYNTQLGLFHDNIFNPFNLASDLMEPFRIVVDRFVYDRKYDKFEPEEKHDLLSILEIEVKVDHQKQVLTNAIKIYARSVFLALEEMYPEGILFYQI